MTEQDRQDWNDAVEAQDTERLLVLQHRLLTDTLNRIMTQDRYRERTQGNSR